MSVKMISWAFKQSVSPTEKLVLIALADHANDEDFTCWPSLSHLVKKTSLHKKTIWKAIDRLVDMGLVRRISDESKRSTTYFLIGAQSTYQEPLGAYGTQDRCSEYLPQVRTAPTLGAYGTPNHNRTIIEPSENQTTLSSKLDSSSPNVKLKNEATEVLQFLNLKTGRAFRVNDTNLKLIVARLKSGASVQDCKTVIARKHREWASDDKMWPYLRPATLFNATKFEQYIGECVTPDKEQRT